MRRYSIRIAAAAAASALAVSLATAATPSHEAALRELIANAVQGRVDEQTLTPALAGAIQPQKAVTQADLTALGPLKSVVLERTGQDGSEYYLTTFERGALEWAFAVTGDGRISNARYRTPGKAP
jgi:hypothetical protein